MKKVGKEGVITISKNQKCANLFPNCMYSDPSFTYQWANYRRRELNDPLILVHVISNAFVKVLELALKKQRPLLIVAEDVESDALAVLILNKLRAETKLITEKLGINLEKVELEMLSTCKRVTISKDESVILDGAGDKKTIEENIDPTEIFIWWQTHHHRGPTGASQWGLGASRSGTGAGYNYHQKGMYLSQQNVQYDSKLMVGTRNNLLYQGAVSVLDGMKDLQVLSRRKCRLKVVTMDKVEAM